MQAVTAHDISSWRYLSGHRPPLQLKYFIQNNPHVRVITGSFATFSGFAYLWPGGRCIPSWNHSRLRQQYQAAMLAYGRHGSAMR